MRVSRKAISGVEGQLRLKIFGPLVLLGAAATLSACGTPVLNDIDPHNGPPHTIVHVDASNDFLAGVFWNANTPLETRVPSGFLGPDFFSVPFDAAPGIYDVRLGRNALYSASQPFQVTVPPAPFPAPRIDRVSVSSAYFGSMSGQPIFAGWIYIQAANGDAGAEIMVDGQVVGSIPHRVLINDLFGVSPTDLGYPIFHYTSYLVPINPVPGGHYIDVQVRNSDSQVSQVFTYRLPYDAASLDSDGDDLLDDWEINGYDADNDGVVDVDLPAMGADPRRPDIFLEIDIMQGLSYAPSSNPSDPVWVAVQDAFASAPIINPIEDQGINLILDVSGTVPFAQLTGFEPSELFGDPNDPNDAIPVGYVEFEVLRDFDEVNRGRIFHYGIWANKHWQYWSGESDVDFNATNVQGDEFIVSFDDFPTSYQTDRSAAETLMHELGHNLGQYHNGTDHFTFNPTYSSVMSYSWQLRSSKTSPGRVNTPVYAPFYYQLNNAVEVSGALPNSGNVGTAIDYSHGMGRPLDESAMDEDIGLYNGNPIDWNKDQTVGGIVTRDLDGDGNTTDIFTDFGNWRALIFSGPRQGGTY